MRVRAVAVVVDGGEVLLIDRKKDGRRYSALPGGGVEPGETLRQARCLEAGETSGPAEPFDFDAFIATKKR